MLRLILGRARSGKTAQIMDEIRANVAEKRAGNILIVPEQYSHEAERELARVCGDTMSLYAEVLSFTRLAHRTAQELGGSARVYTDKGGRLLQLTLAMEQLDGALKFYGGAVRQPELLQKLGAALTELRCAKADGDRLRKAAEETTAPLSDKLHDLALLSDAAEALNARTGADPATRLDHLIEQIPHSLALQGAAVYIDGFTDFTAQERQVIRELWRVSDVTVCLTCDELTDGSEVFSLSRRTARKLLAEAKEDALAADVLYVSPAEMSGAMGFLEEHLFDWTADTFPAEGAVRLVTAPGIAEECELAAAEVLRAARERGLRWRDMAIAVRGFEDYRSVLTSTFRRYGIPLYTSTRTDILNRPLPALIGAAFDILADGWSYESVFTYLKTGLADITHEECDELENYVLLWSLRGSAWTREAPWRQHPAGYGGTPSAESDELLRRLDTLRRRIAAPLAAFAERGKAAATAWEQCRALADFLEDISLADRLSERADTLERAGEAQTASEYWQLWDRMADALEQCAAVLGDMPMEQQTFGRLFRRMLSEYDIGTIPVALDRVTAGDFDRMRRRSIRCLLVLGASDDRLPRVGDTNGLFSDEERSALRALNVELSDPEDDPDREFSLIYNVMTLPSESLWVSRSLYTAGGAETGASFLTSRIEKLFAIREERGDLSDARRAAAGPALALACGGDAAARAYFADSEEETRRMADIERAARFTRGRLGRESVKALYGERIYLTASRVDNFASCRFRYFLQYGLKAKSRQSAGFDPPALGTFLHRVLEQTAKKASARGGFPALTEEEIAALTDECVAEYVHEQMDDFREKSPRFVYLFNRLTEEVRRIVLDTAGELCRSDFKPLDFELNFSENRDMPPISIGQGDEALVFTGVADRVDGWEHDGKLYLRVMDYKSGEKKFALTDVWYGMGLQMLLYLFTLEKEGETYYRKPIVPAGVLYIPARDALVSAPGNISDQEILAEKAKKVRRSGLLLAEDEVLQAMEHGTPPRYIPVKLNRSEEYTGDSLATAQQLAELSRHVDDTLKSMAKELHRGSIAADPWYRSENENTCLYCEYYNACHFDEKTDSRRFKTKLKAPDFWAKLEAKEGGGEA